MNSQVQNTINIAIAGHTNTGKTTLIRTFMHFPAGEVADSPNVTKRGTAYYYDGLHATFIDTPGFQHASAVSLYLDGKEEDPNFKMPRGWIDKLDFDMDAIKSLEKSHIVLYVGSLSVVPDDSYKEEISIVKKIQPKIVAILNQKKRQTEASGEEKTDSRIAQWKAIFKEQGIESVVVFDAHWDKPEKVNQIYDKVHNTLDPNHRQLFNEGLKQFKDRQDEIRQEASIILAKCIQRCQKHSNISVKKGNYLESEAKQRIAEELYEETLVFLTRIAKLYQIAAEHPTESKEELKIRLKESVDFGARVRSGTLISSIFAGGGAAIGATIGAGVAGIFSGGLGIGAGAVLGSQIGGGIGATIGGLGIFTDDEDNVEVGVDSEEIRNIAAANLAAVWGLSNVGFGRDKELEQGEIEEIKKKILSSELLPSNLNWIEISREEIICYSNEALEKLELIIL